MTTLLRSLSLALQQEHPESNEDRVLSAVPSADVSIHPLADRALRPAALLLMGAVGTVLQAEFGNGPIPVLSTNSSTANNARRTWMKIEDFIQEVANGRIYDGVHFRNSTEVGTAMGRKIGQLAATKYFGKAM